MSTREITLKVNPTEFFDMVSKVGIDAASSGIGARIVSTLLSGGDWRDLVGLGVYGIGVSDSAALSRVTVEGLAGVIGVEIATRQDGEPEPSINELAQALVSYINGGKENG